MGPKQLTFYLKATNINMVWLYNRDCMLCDVTTKAKTTDYLKVSYFTRKVYDVGHGFQTRGRIDCTMFRATTFVNYV